MLTYYTHIFTATALSKVLFDGGYAQMSGNTPTYLFFLTDHLGSVRVVTDENGTVRQVNQYYPYGDLIEDARMVESTSDNRYRFTGKELATETGLYDFCARYLETSMGRFTTIDPLAEKCPSVSPYVYCAGDPVNRVDPDGRTDYFNNDGEFLYNDGRDNGMIKISTSEQIEELKNQLEASNISSVQRKNILISFSNNSAKFSERILDMSDDAIISVYNHYNYTGLELVENNNLLNKNFAFNKRTQNIEVNVALNKTNKGLNSNSYDIINAINEHEGMHYEDYKESKLEGHNEAYWEIRAIEHQMTSPSWSRASEGYRKAIESYLEKWKLKGPQ